MPRTKDAVDIVDQASSSLPALVEELAEPLALYMLGDYTDED
jgi:hypothetical protein